MNIGTDSLNIRDIIELGDNVVQLIGAIKGVMLRNLRAEVSQDDNRRLVLPGED